MAIKHRIKPEGYGRSFVIFLGGLLIMGIGFCSSYVIFKGFSYDPNFDIRKAWSSILWTVVWSLGFILAGIWLLRRSRFRYDTQEEFEKESIETKAKVVDRFYEVIPGRGYEEDDHITCYVIIKFDTESGQITLRADLLGKHEKIFNETSPADSVKVRYAATNPRIALLDGEY